MIYIVLCGVVMTAGVSLTGIKPLKKGRKILCVYQIQAFLFPTAMNVELYLFISTGFQKQIPILHWCFCVTKVTIILQERFSDQVNSIAE